METNKPKKFKPKRFSSGLKHASPKEAETKAKSYKHLYGTREWIEFSRRFLHYNPKCYACGRDSRITDHIITHRGDMELFWKETNYLALCISCHNYATAKFDRHHKPKTVEKLEWLKTTRAARNLTHKVKVIPLNR